VSFFYVFDAGGEALEAAVAEVTNTPWRERHAYVLAPEGGRAAPTLRARVPKGLHVSPFLPMDLEHRLRVRRPGRRLALAVEDTRRGARVLCARLVARRRPLDGPALAGALARFPLQPLRVLAGIYGHALRLALAGAPFHPHPGGAPASAPPPERVR